MSGREKKYLHDLVEISKGRNRLEDQGLDA
jgi:hypothetical protein